MHVGSSRGHGVRAGPVERRELAVLRFVGQEHKNLENEGLRVPGVCDERTRGRHKRGGGILRWTRVHGISRQENKGVEEGGRGRKTQAGGEFGEAQVRGECVGSEQ